MFLCLQEWIEEGNHGYVIAAIYQTPDRDEDLDLIPLSLKSVRTDTSSDEFLVGLVVIRGREKLQIFWIKTPAQNSKYFASKHPKTPNIFLNFIAKKKN